MGTGYTVGQWDPVGVSEGSFATHSTGLCLRVVTFVTRARLFWVERGENICEFVAGQARQAQGVLDNVLCYIGCSCICALFFCFVWLSSHLFLILSVIYHESICPYATSF